MPDTRAVSAPGTGVRSLLKCDFEIHSCERKAARSGLRAQRSRTVGVPARSFKLGYRTTRNPDLCLLVEARLEAAFTPAMLRVLVLLLVTITPFSTRGQNKFSDVQKELTGIQKEAGMRAASIGFCMISMDSVDDAMAVGYRMDTALIPASTMKLITTATALEKLGADFRFETELQISGTLSADGVLNGHLVVKGGGDPTLGESEIADTFARWRSALSDAGVKRIEGSIVGDASLFGTQRVPNTWQWGDMGNYYGAGACGLTFHQNQFYCTFRTLRVGSKAILLGTDPKLPDVEFLNEMRVGPGGSGDKGRVYGQPYGKTFILRGTVPADSTTFTIKGALPDPAYFCARAFTKYLIENGIEITGEPRTDRLLAAEGKSAGKRETIYKQHSQPLGELIRLVNHKSNNLMAECIHRMIGVRSAGKIYSDAAGGVVRDNWAAMGIDMDGFRMEDGCGLSLANSMTARQMTLILRRMGDRPTFDSFYASLPVAGRSGTLRSIGRGTSAEGRVVAKSGTIDRIKNYAGYVNTRSGKRYAFVLFINNYTCSTSTVKAKIVRIWNRIVSID
jgi:D-alanyl-D-alanine carboxypeptidase/D-alanyl-D-alanine-endopeptidase (penicillin-binding protein 4)